MKVLKLATIIDASGNDRTLRLPSSAPISGHINPHSAPWGVTIGNYLKSISLSAINYAYKRFYLSQYNEIKYRK